MPDDLYDRDILLWSERQSALLRRLAAGERVNDSVDWEHVVEEVADVGLAELHAVESLLAQALLHLLKLWAEPDAPSARHWQAEILGFLNGARRRYAPSMRRKLDLDDLWRESAAQASLIHPRLTPPAACPWALDALLSRDAHPAALLSALIAEPQGAEAHQR